MNKRIWLIGSIMVAGWFNTLASDGVDFNQIKVSENQHYLTHQDGKPFFYMADTAWELFHRLTREEAQYYLEDRANKGFTVIQAVAIAELDGISTGNAYGHLPFEKQDPTKPAVKEGPANDYWDLVDFIVNEANKRGLFIGFLPTWGRYWHDGSQPVFNPQNAETYCHWLASQYKNANIIWILGGDRNADSERDKAIICAIAKGLREGDSGKHLITNHPTGGASSADFFIDENWLDFNMRQNGHDNDWYTYTDSTYILVYTPVGRAFTVHTSYIRGKTLKAWWFNPRTGKTTNAVKFKNEGKKTFFSPTPGELHDWILVIDDASKDYPKPGSKELPT